jgi:hypothetical protein
MERAAKRLGSLNQHHYHPTAISQRSVLTTPLLELPSTPQPSSRRVRRIENVSSSASVGSVSSEDAFQATHLLKHTRLHSTNIGIFSMRKAFNPPDNPTKA